MLHFANERGVPVIPRGSRTNLSAATVPHRGGIVLVLTRMNKIKEVSDAQLVAVCGPGMESAGQPARKKGMKESPTPKV